MFDGSMLSDGPRQIANCEEGECTIERREGSCDQGLWPNEADIASLDYDWASFPMQVTYVPFPVIRLATACNRNTITHQKTNWTLTIAWQTVAHDGS